LRSALVARRRGIPAANSIEALPGRGESELAPPREKKSSALSGQTDMSEQKFLAQLAKVLPNVVSGLTSNGRFAHGARTLVLIGPSRKFTVVVAPTAKRRHASSHARGAAKS
jgi:hypothetical protein